MYHFIISISLLVANIIWYIEKGELFGLFTILIILTIFMSLLNLRNLIKTKEKRLFTSLTLYTLAFITNPVFVIYASCYYSILFLAGECL